jgi:signal transduction histidine kinase
MIVPIHVSMKESLPYNELLKYVAKLESKVIQLEKQVEEDKKKSEQLKTGFLSNISHEIRTPMNAILGFSSLLNDQYLPGNKREEYMNHITQSSAKLLNMVDAMIDISLIEGGQLKISPEECRINQLLKDIYYNFNIDRHRSGRNHIALLLNLQVKDDDFLIYTDPFRLNQIMTNLLTNAFNYSDKGIVEFGYFLEGENDRITFFVTDSGKGVLKEKSKVILESTSNNEYSNQKIEGGLGLGLTLSKGIIKLMGGKIWVEENAFKGSTFKFSLPYRIVREMGSNQLNPFISKMFIA